MQKMLLVISVAVLLCGCSNYNFSRAVYEGVQTGNQLNATPTEQINTPQLNYDQYETERKR